jgi:hypothetical protein
VHRIHWPANARLIAAAPDLLEALKCLGRVCDANAYEIPMGYRNQVFLAIAKAEGKNSRLAVFFITVQAAVAARREARHMYSQNHLLVVHHLGDRTALNMCRFVSP